MLRLPETSQSPALRLRLVTAVLEPEARVTAEPAATSDVRDSPT